MLEDWQVAGSSSWHTEGTHSAKHLDVALPASRTQNSKFLLCKPLCLWCSAKAALGSEYTDLLILPLDFFFFTSVNVCLRGQDLGEYVDPVHSI